eukprot:CAMPEP_0119108356 /NCGR_PEP_ID=MMETSP1180-20130426/13914_1 /TAXON_ID=3052 ORGANISM="Chlamydomonas cf sp, Strain CCMP681" /NCGR_SAMPLE_ID=MMETSP1180 /ASSEMBLY_ACC=CAM_ASM_000741 /LENGTH=488 /DNA_ID=CAMNT_0007093959 /DNA_START=19 /DNA_END=1485 /DNA_ORIENTATION=-
MAQCVICTTALATVFCVQDKAFLCAACDKTIHAANPISRNHKRLPTCMLCHRSVASVYCCGDEASLCSTCLTEVHSANPLAHLHVVLPIEQALAEGKATLTGLPAVPTPGSAGSGIDDSISACGDTSLAVVPEMPGMGPEDPACGSNGHYAPPGKDNTFAGLDDLDLDASWFTGMDPTFDFNEFLGYGLVPTLPAPAEDQHDPTNGASASAAMTQTHLHATHMPCPPESPGLLDDFVVPSFLPQENMDFAASPAVSLLPLGMEMVKPCLSNGSRDSHGPNLDLQTNHSLGSLLLTSALPSSMPSGNMGSGNMGSGNMGHDGCDLTGGLQGHPHPLMYGMQRSHSRQDQRVPVMNNGSGQGGMYCSGFGQFLPNDMMHQAPQSYPSAQTMIGGRMSMQPVGQGAVMSSAPPPPQPPAPSAAHHHHGNGANLTREQRVARYLEKRKNRSFAKTIRYASRKAYAEVRPRIKGRFATKVEMEEMKVNKEVPV